MDMKLRRTALASSVLIASLLLAGCSNPMQNMSMGGSPTADESTAAFNDADVAFTMNMVVHHNQAIEMADVLLGKDGIDPQVVQLARDIDAAQRPEIDLMNDWLDAWGAGGMSGMDHGMAGTMSEADMAALGASSGDEAGRLFLEQMIVHHEGAIEMARAELRDGESRDAIALAEKIVTAQTAEIAEMRDLLANA